jgi:hypothetical protein
VRAVFGGGISPNPIDLGKNGRKHHVMIDGGVPLADLA